MTAKVDSLISDIGEMRADLDDLLEAKKEKYGELFKRIVEDPSLRDIDLWEADGSPVEYSLADLMSIYPIDRDAEWEDAVASLLASAKTQAMLDSGILRGLLDLSESNGEKLNAHSKALSFEEMRLAAVKMKGSGVTDAAKSRRSNPARVPD